MFSTKSIRIASFVIMIYILLAISWWAILLYREHDALFDAYEVIQQEERIGEYPRITAIRNMTAEELSKQRQRKTVMIVSEALFIGFGLLIGIFIINNGYRNLVRAEKLKQNFLLSISHELKSPIASAKLAFETLKRFNKSDERGNKIIHQGLKETNRLNELVQNVLLATRLESGYLPEIAEVDVGEQVKSLVSRVQMKSPDAQINLTVYPNPMVVKIDRQALDIVFNNLLENAVKYSEGPPTVEINIKRDKNNLNILVGDQGIGISDVEKEKIFNRFYRVGEERKRKTIGTGLGLYLVRELILKNKGSIKIKDNKPSGSIFSISWPLDEKY